MLRNVPQLLQSLVLKARRGIIVPGGEERLFFFSPPPRLGTFTGNCRNFHPHPEHSAGSHSCSTSFSSFLLEHLHPSSSSGCEKKKKKEAQPASDNVTFCQSAGEHAAVAAGSAVAATEIDSNKCRRGRAGRGRGEGEEEGPKGADRSRRKDNRRTEDEWWPAKSGFRSPTQVRAFLRLFAEEPSEAFGMFKSSLMDP